MNDRIRPDRHVGPDIGRGRIDQSDARRHQGLVDPALEQPTHDRQFRAGVDAPDLVGVVEPLGENDTARLAIESTSSGR